MRTWITTDQAARLAGLNDWTVKKLAQAGKIPGCEQPNGRGSRYRIDLDAFTAALAAGALRKYRKYDGALPIGHGHQLTIGTADRIAELDAKVPPRPKWDDADPDAAPTFRGIDIERSAAEGGATYTPPPMPPASQQPTRPAVPVTNGPIPLYQLTVGPTYEDKARSSPDLAATLSDLEARLAEEHARILTDAIGAARRNAKQEIETQLAAITEELAQVKPIDRPLPPWYGVIATIAVAATVGVIINMIVLVIGAGA